MRKTAITSLNPTSEADSEDDSAALESLEEFCNPFAESAEASVHPAAFSDPTSTPSSSSSSSSSSETATAEVDSLTTEAELVINQLREARLQVSKSNDLGPSKKLVEALIDIIIQEFHGDVYEEEENWIDKLLFTMIGLTCFMLVLMVWFLN